MQYLYERYIGDEPQSIESFEEEILNADIARKYATSAPRPG